MSLSKITGYGTFGTLGGTFAYRLINRKEFTSDKLQQIQRLEFLILGIATTQYGITLSMNDITKIQRWRYLDWLVTTPLLLKTFHLLAQEKGFEGSFLPALGANLIMITSGYLAEFARTPEQRFVYFVIGFAMLAIILYYVREWEQYLVEQGVDTKNLATFFYIGWTLYGLNFLVRNEQVRQIGFNVLDLFNKGIYSFALTEVINEQFT